MVHLIINLIKFPSYIIGINMRNTDQFIPKIVVPNFTELRIVDEDCVDLPNDIYVTPIHNPIKKVQIKVEYGLVS